MPKVMRIETRGEFAGATRSTQTTREVIAPERTRLMPPDLPEVSLTENARKVLANRYLKKDKVTGEVVETPKELFWRVASAVCRGRPSAALPAPR